MTDIEKLQIQIGEMAAEVERLQGLIDDATAQEPYAWDSAGDLIYHPGMLLNDPKPIPLYASPIPAQQSTTADVPADYKEELFQLRQQAENWSTKLGLITSAINSRKISLSAKEREFPHLLIERLHTDSELLKQRTESSRITEQDAREIINSYAYSWEGSNVKPSCFNIWNENLGGRALLNKLNNHECCYVEVGSDENPITQCTDCGKQKPDNVGDV